MLSCTWLFATLWTVRGSSVHGVFQATIIKWIAISYYIGSPQPMDLTQVSWVSLHWQADSLPTVPPGMHLPYSTTIYTEILIGCGSLRGWEKWNLPRNLSEIFPLVLLPVSVFFFIHPCFPDNSVGKESACNAGDPGLIPGLGISPGEGNGNRLQYSCLENPMDREPGRLQSMGWKRVGHDWATFTHTFPSQAWYKKC